MINYLDLKYQLLQKSHHLDRSKLVEVERTFTKNASPEALAMGI